MWGTLYLQSYELLGYRFIPTHVGNTIACLIISIWLPVHPHACGEHGISRKSLMLILGSSPRMWGTLGLAVFDCVDCRFIPTHVGNTHNVIDRDR